MCNHEKTYNQKKQGNTEPEVQKKSIKFQNNVQSIKVFLLQKLFF